jgi:hypothetical protein
LGIVDFYILLDGIKNRLEFREKAGPVEKGTYIP